MYMLVTSVLTLHAGAIIGLRPDQAATRQPFLKAVPKKKDWYEVLATIQFKVGEAIQYDGELPKSMVDIVEAPGAKSKAEGKGKAKEPVVTRDELDKALAALPGDHTGPDYVVNGMRGHFGALFTADDEAKVRELVKAPLDDSDKA